MALYAAIARREGSQAQRSKRVSVGMGYGARRNRMPGYCWRRHSVRRAGWLYELETSSTGVLVVAAIVFAAFLGTLLGAASMICRGVRATRENVESVPA